VDTPPAYPPHWEADVVLSDGGTAHLRPIRPDDTDRLLGLFRRLSPNTVYRRFFAPRTDLTPTEVERFCTVDYDARVALVALLGGEMVAVARYERLEGAEAEVAFVVEDAQQGRGLGPIGLEHLAAAAAERGVRRFVAEVLPGNRQMIGVFTRAGYRAEHTFADGVVHLSFDIAETADSIEVRRAREHRAEARSIERLLSPRSVAVVGASRKARGVGRRVLDNVVAGGFAGPVVAIHPEAGEVGGVAAYRCIGDVPGGVDLVVVAVPAEQVPAVAGDAAAAGARGLVVVSAGFAETGPAGERAQAELVALVRSAGMRLVGPNCLGVLRSAAALNATFAPDTPVRGRVGFFCQSGALGVAILEAAATRGLGLSTFVSAGNRADVSGNDLLQYWYDDGGTDVVLLYLESFGNPRKFGRLARLLARRKPVVVVKSGRSLAGVPAGHAGVAVAVPDEAVDAVFAGAGVIRVDTVAQLLDVAQLLAFQPLPAGPRAAIVANSSALAVLAADACAGAGLTVSASADLGPSASAGDFDRALRDALADIDVDSVLTVFVPPLATPDAEVGRVVADAARESDKPVVSTFVAMQGVPEQLRRTGPDGGPGRGSVPSYRSPETAVLALARATRYAAWRRRDPGALPDLAGIDPAAAERVVSTALRREPAGGLLDDDECASLLSAYGIDVVGERPAGSGEQAATIARTLGYPVALKAGDEALRHRTDLGGVRLDVADDAALRTAYDGLRRLDPGREDVVVQAMAPPGVPVVVSVVEDPSFGALVSLGLGGVATDLLGDRAYRGVPLTDVDAAELVRAPRAAPLLFGYRGVPPADVLALEELLLRVSRLADDRPELAALELNPVLVGTSGASNLGASARVAPAAPRFDTGPRRLR
jgi:acyl-CoA synthetase (NDP forming)/RimJ/RimL family protein N-acetyltransferase